MADKLKDLFFTRETLEVFATSIKNNYSKFDKEKFLALVFDDGWKNLELKARMRHTTLCLKQTLPQDFSQAVAVLKKAAPSVKGFEAMTLHDYVELYGLDAVDESLDAILFFCQFASGEFAIRPFLHAHPQKTMAFMQRCADNKDENIRRFASEGCRPRLPWAMALPKFKKDPSLIIPILKKLRDDESEFVRNSVANNLNDISKDNPHITLELCKKWKGESERTDWVVKHACRTLLKAGNVQAMLLFGFGDPAKISIENLTVEKESLSIGDDQYFSFTLKVAEKKKCNIRLEYAVAYVKANGKSSKKIFQISEKVYKPGEYQIKRKQTFMDMSTRKHYPGIHAISVIVNGAEKADCTFMLHK